MEAGRETANSGGKEPLHPVEAGRYFSADYLTARARFREAVHPVGWELETYPLNLTGPQGETLSVDVALSPGVPSAPVLVVSSGLHGVEGLFGSAVQLAWLDHCADRDEHTSLRQVLIHALNPHGFAWGRRVNEANIDLNRNFLPPNETYAGCPDGYRALCSFLNPQKPPPAWDPFLWKAIFLLARHGTANLQQAIAVGQYEYPQGLFFGGQEPAWQQEFLSTHLSEWIGESPDVLHLDLHTGLGPWGKCNILVDYPLESDRLERLQTWFGSAALKAYESHTVSYQAKGGLGQWVTAKYRDRAYRFAFAEFGTYGPISILKGLRAENQAHHWGDPSASITQKTKARLQELFCPADLTWRQSVLNEALERLEQASEGLNASQAGIHEQS